MKDLSLNVYRQISLLMKLVAHFSYLEGKQGKNEELATNISIKNEEVNILEFNDTLKIYTDEAGINVHCMNSHLMYNGEQIYEHIIDKGQYIDNVRNIFKSYVADVEEQFKKLTIYI